MTSIVTNKLFDIKDFRKHSPYFIETGLAAGDGLDRALKAGFTNCKSVEAWEPFYQAGLIKYANDDRVKLFLGKSSELLPDMLEHSRAVILLDSHPAGPNTAGHDDLMEKGAASEFNQDTIITNELKAILNHGNNHVVILDDQDINSTDNIAYRQMLLDANPDYRFYWFNEQLNENAIFYKNKLLVAIPE